MMGPARIRQRWRGVLLVGASVLAGGCDDGGADGPGVDDRDTTCVGEVIALPTTSNAQCGEPAASFVEASGAAHIADDVPIAYPVEPPSSGPHRGSWARWGAYDWLPPQRWLHNLEHGGIAVLYDPCLDPAAVTALRAWLNARPADATGAFRWVLTPYPGLNRPLTVVAWEHTLALDCWTSNDIAAVEAFVTEQYREAPEDVPFDGTFSEGWLGR
jgi:hypothetical protein